MKYELNRTFSLLTSLFLLLAPLDVVAGGPRWYTGPPFYTASNGLPVVFFTTSPLYYTDAGDLNANVSHAQADAMVAAAAAVWNVPTSLLTLAQGGVLAEHVSGSNMYFDGTQVVWPDDVQLANYQAKPIAIIYDTDGSVIDTLLGSGASEPAACRQNAVVESVDGLDPDGTIHHALLILNGRCVGSNADQLTQMRYQLTREFGRIIGLAWSQLNDNVFTGTPTPTLAEALRWPLMHPIDVICGPYTFKCMAQPFTLRDDDLAALARLYPVTAANITSGKTLSSDGASYLFGRLTFPTGQGIDAANIVMVRESVGNAIEDGEVVSAVTGMGFQQVAGNPVSGAPSGAAESNGNPFSETENEYVFARMPLPGGLGYRLYFTAESINPLYTGDYAIGPYAGPPTSMSGPAYTFIGDYVIAGLYYVLAYTAPQAATSCNPGNDGTEAAPATADASGFWTGQLCASRHTSWWSQNVQAGRTWTVEVTATDENGVVSTSKARPLIGAWNATHPRGTAPTVAATPGAFNGQTLGMTQLQMSAASANATLRIAVADDRGHGRPDFGYKMRVLYADSVVPTQLGASGGRITISGEGFRNGNRVTVNGVAATVISWSANTIVATAPTRTTAHVTAASNVDVAVIDASTGGSSVMQAVLSYAGMAANTITLVSAPAQLTTGTASATPLAVRVMASDGVTPVAGAGVRFAVTTGTATFAACGAAPCTVLTDSGGYAQSVLTASVAGMLALSATELSGGASVQATATVSDAVRLIALVSAPSTLSTGAASATAFAIRVTAADGVTAVAGAHVQLTASGLAATFAACGAASCTLTTDATGYAGSTVSASAPGTLVLSATELSFGANVQASVTVSNPVRLIALVSAPTSLSTGTASTTAFGVRVTAADGVTAVAGAHVQLAASGLAATLAACGAASCTLTTDATGYAGSTVTASAAGTLVLSATELSGGANVQASVVVSDPVKLIALVSAPAQAQTGVTSTTLFAVRVTGGDGATPIAGASVRFAVLSGLGAFSACGLAVCTAVTDSSGYARTAVTASAAGTLVLSATEVSGGANVQASVAVSDPVRLIAVVSAPAKVETGLAAAAPLVVRVTAADGTTPVSGASVRLAVTMGSATFAVCGAATCTLTTDASGLVQSSFTAGAAGMLVLMATELKGGATVQTTVAVSDPVRTVSIADAPRYLAAGAASQWTVSLTATQDGAAATGTAVAWSAGTGLFLGTVSGTTDAQGVASVSVLTAGLAAGAQAVVQGCIWTGVCASSMAIGVGAAQWTVTALGGANQSVPAVGTLSAVTLRVTDAAGHALEGAGMTIYQTVDAWEGTCPAQGRCASAPVLAASQTSATSGVDGTVTVTPLEVAGVPSVVHIAAVTGTQGFVSLTLTKTP